MYVIEDCAQSTGPPFVVLETGAWGNPCCLAFTRLKISARWVMGSTGDKRPRSWQNGFACFGNMDWRERYISDLPGMNTAWTNSGPLSYESNCITLTRRMLAGTRSGTSLRFISLGDNTDTSQGYAFDAHHVYHQYVVRSERRDALESSHKNNSVWYLDPLPVACSSAACLPRTDSYSALAELEHTERLCREMLSLPMHPQMSDRTGSSELVNLFYSEDEADAKQG